MSLSNLQHAGTEFEGYLSQLAGEALQLQCNLGNCTVQLNWLMPKSSLGPQPNPSGSSICV